METKGKDTETSYKNVLDSLSLTVCVKQVCVVNTCVRVQSTENQGSERSPSAAAFFNHSFYIWKQGEERISYYRLK